MFFASVYNLKTLRKDTCIEFDKDDDDAMSFVVACTNLRAFNFGIPLESKFKIKEMAGKIVPAISSSNALVASLSVLEAIKVLNKDYESIKGISYMRQSERKITSISRSKEEPNPDCPVCSDDSVSIGVLKIGCLDSIKLKDLVDYLKDNIIKDVAEYSIGFGKEILVEVSEDQDEDEIEMYKRKMVKNLFEFGIRDNSIIEIE